MNPLYCKLLISPVSLTMCHAVLKTLLPAAAQRLASVSSCVFAEQVTERTSKYLTRFVPGMGNTSGPCACTHASASWPGVQLFLAASSFTLSTTFIFASKASFWNLGNPLLKSLSLHKESGQQADKVGICFCIYTGTPGKCCYLAALLQRRLMIRMSIPRPLQGAWGADRKGREAHCKSSGDLMAPVRKPRPSGLYATMPIPSSRRVGTISACKGEGVSKLIHRIDEWHSHAPSTEKDHLH